jgi:hypothetical protein
MRQMGHISRVNPCVIHERGAKSEEDFTDHQQQLKSLQAMEILTMSLLTFLLGLWIGCPAGFFLAYALTLSRKNRPIFQSREAVFPMRKHI